MPHMSIDGVESTSDCAPTLGAIFQQLIQSGIFCLAQMENQMLLLIHAKTLNSNPEEYFLCILSLEPRAITPYVHK